MLIAQIIPLADLLAFGQELLIPRYVALGAGISFPTCLNSQAHYCNLYLEQWKEIGRELIKKKFVFSSNITSWGFSQGEQQQGCLSWLPLQ